MYKRPPPLPPTFRQRWWRGLWRPPTPRPLMWLTLVLGAVMIGVLGIEYQVLALNTLGHWGLLLVLVGMACTLMPEVFPPRWIRPAGVLRLSSTLTVVGGFALILLERLIYALQ